MCNILLIRNIFSTRAKYPFAEYEYVFVPSVIEARFLPLDQVNDLSPYVNTFPLASYVNAVLFTEVSLSVNYHRLKAVIINPLTLVKQYLT